MFKFLGDLTKVLVEHNRIRSREVEARLHDDKRRAYLRVLSAWWKLMDRVAAGSEQLPKRDQDEFKAAKQEMMMFAAGNVIELWNEMERAAGLLAAGESVEREGLLRFDRIMRAMRQDLGYDDSELAEGQLLALLIRGDDKDSLLSP